METTAAHKNNFDFLRFLFASLVIVTHCYALLQSNPMADPAFKLTERVFSDYAVCGFFVLSGFLIRQSLSRSISRLAFFKKRAFRIFPGLWIAILITTFLIGTTTTTLPLSQYIANSQTWKYLLNNSCLIPLQKTLPGLFEHNVETSVNGSLWTLRYELLFYVLLSLLFFFPKKIKVISIATLFFCLIGNHLIKSNIIVINHSTSFITYFMILGSYFAAGACLSLFPDFIKKQKTPILILSSILFFASVLIFKTRFESINTLTFSLMVLSFGLHYFRALNFSQYTGDISYGTYIYAYPIQQALIVWLHPSNIIALLIPSLALSWLAGWLSWHFIEKRFLLKKQV